MGLKILNKIDLKALGLSLLVSVATLATYAEQTPVNLSPKAPLSIKSSVVKSLMAQKIQSLSVAAKSETQQAKAPQKPIKLQDSNQSKDTQGGGFNGGGGEPLANDFLKKAELISQAIELDLISGIKGSSLNEDSFAIPVDASRFREITKKIRKSLDDQNPLLVFPPGETLDCFGEPKIGCVSNDGIIHVARNGYLSLSSSRQFELVALEYFKLMSLLNRYELAQYVEYYMRGKDEKIDASFKEDIQGLIYQVDRLINFTNMIIENVGHDKIIKNEKLGAICFQVAQLYSGNLAYANLARNFIRKMHPRESTFQITNKEFGIIGNLETTGMQEIGLPYFCGSDASFTINNAMIVNSHIEKGHAADLLDKVIKPTLNDLNTIKSNLQNY